MANESNMRGTVLRIFGVQGYEGTRIWGKPKYEGKGKNIRGTISQTARDAHASHIICKWMEKQIN